MDIDGKVWGTTACILKLPMFELHRIEVKAGGYCSEHIHRAKHNLFYVESGVLKVTLWNDGPGASVLAGGKHAIDETIMRPGDSMPIPPNRAHKFEGVSAVVAYEVYWAELSEDIERRTQGGLRRNEP